MSPKELEQAIGQLIIGKVPALELDEGNKDCLRKGIISGITVFKENVQSQEQLMDLCDSVKRFSFHSPVIAVDQEGGAVQRLDDIISPLPSMMAIGRLKDAGETLKMLINLSGKQLRLLGINCVFAPVLDVNTNPRNPIIGTRALGDDPTQIAKLGRQIIAAYLEAGVLPVAKHFPGHGDSDIDSHLALPVLEHELERLKKIELVPFVENIETSPAILVAHLWIKCLDPDEILPATLSTKVTSELLKEKLGFKNLVVSDDMLMKAIGNEWGLAEACIKGVEAGLDLLLVCSGADDALSVHEALVKAVETGRLERSRIDAAVRAREIALARLPEFERIERDKKLSILARSMAASEKLLVECSSAAISLDRGIPREIFRQEGIIDILIPESPRYRLPYKETLCAELPQLADKLKEHRYSINPGEEEIRKLEEACGENCILVTFRACINKEQIKLADRLYEKTRNRLLIAADIPYDLDYIVDWENAVSICDPSDLAVRAFAHLMAQQLSGFTNNQSKTDSAS